MTQPYTYYIFWTKPNVGYIGVRWANELPAEEDLWHIYKTSSRLVQTLAPRLGDPDVRLYWEHETAEEAQEHEKQLFDRLGDDVRENWMLNRCFSWQSPGGWNKGKPLSEETRKKITEAKKGKPRSEATRKKISEARKGRPNPMKGRPGKPHSEETRKKMSEAHKGKPRKPVSEETRKKMSEAHKGKPHSEESRKKMSESKIRYWKENKS